MAKQPETIEPALPARRSGLRVPVVVALGVLAVTVLGFAGYTALNSSKQAEPRIEAPAPAITNPEPENESAASSPAETLAFGTSAMAAGVASAKPGAPQAPQPPVLPGRIGTEPDAFGGPPPVTPIVITGGQDGSNALARYVEVSIRVPEMDIEGTLGSAAGMAAEAGGSSTMVLEPRTARTPERRGVILSIPDSKLGEVQAKLLAFEIAVLRDEWRGSIAERELRLEKPLRDIVSELDREERVALERYLDDAPLVVDIRERIERARREIAKLPRPKASTTLVRVYVLHRS